jgi:hypothetical protein
MVMNREITASGEAIGGILPVRLYFRRGFTTIHQELVDASITYHQSCLMSGP